MSASTGLPPCAGPHAVGDARTGEAARGAWRAAAALARGLRSAWTLRRGRRRAVAAIAALDAETRRDLAVHLAEADSYWAESVGLAERTRLRVALMSDLRGPSPHPTPPVRRRTP